ncbi:MAG: hypothetical protein ABIR52_14485 [Casimicrobiaceae bacterium]
MLLRGEIAAWSLAHPPRWAASCVSDQEGVTCALPAPQSAPFDTVVVLMMENRSFDHRAARRHACASRAH